MTDSLPYKEILDHLYDGVYFVDRQRRITYWNQGAERISGFHRAAVLGRRCADSLLVHIDEQGTLLCNDLCPVAKTLQDGMTREAEVYLHHAGGHRVPVLVRVTPLHDKAGNITGAVEVFSDNTSLIGALKRLSELHQIANQDALTGLGNRRFLQDRLGLFLPEVEQHHISSGLLFIDIDHFKKVNDRWGHEAGDRVLQMVANTLRCNIRSIDLLGRWGGEEFLMAISNVNQEQLLALAEKLRILVERSYIDIAGSQLSVTISIGASLNLPGDTPETLIQRADALLYRSKRAGRNRVTLG